MVKPPYPVYGAPERRISFTTLPNNDANRNRNRICRMTKYDVRTAKFQFPWFNNAVTCSTHSDQQSSTPRLMSLLHLPTPSTLVSS